jgi:phosphodiesterase/alkaline phosphatase D-like protein
MVNVIIGHTTDRSARIWLRGNRRTPWARVCLEGEQQELVDQHELRLQRSRDYTGLVDFTYLEPQTTYTVRADFTSRSWLRRPRIERAPLGQFRTAPSSATDSREPQLTFIFGSCNLTNVKVNNVLGLVAGVIGSYVFGQALRRECNPPERDFFVVKWTKAALQFASSIVAWGVYKVTKYRQPGPPWIASPFLRLATLFRTWQVTTVKGGARPGVGTLVTGELSAATGIVAFATNAEPRKEAKPASEQKSARAKESANDKDPADDEESTDDKKPTSDKKPESRDADEEQRLVLVPTNDKRFVGGERLVWGEIRDGDYVSFAGINRVEEQKPTSRPQLMLHLGDQIYFDFPTRDPRPTLRNYRRAYREAWCEDDVAAHFLAQCPQYMTLDDHEIFNNFATDAVAPRPRLGAAGYSVPALAAYDEYVHVRHPHPESTSVKCPECGQRLGSGRPLYYSFSHGDVAHFFVMDTRTERYNGGLIDEPGRMISCCQLATLKRWLRKRRKNDLVFIVTSVPFVPEVHATADEVPVNDQRRRVSLDKWCAAAFTAQREAIVRYIVALDLKRVVFLAGDMHCCYHAVMKIRPTRKPSRCVTIHELGAGPIYQLRLARATNFYEVYRGAYGTDNHRLSYASRVQHFYSLANAAMTVTVATDGRDSGTHILWDVIPTVGQPHPEDRERDTVSGLVRAKRGAKQPNNKLPPLDPAQPVLRGKICFSP